MRAFVLFAFVLLLVTSCNKEETDYAHNRTSFFRNINDSVYSDSLIVCVTFNIQLGFSADKDPWNKDTYGADTEQIKRISEYLKKVNPDIIALQEVPRNRSNALVKNFIEELAGELNMNYAFGSHGYNDPYGIYPVVGEWGTAILTKFRIVGIHNEEVEYVSIWEKRSLLDVELEASGNKRFHAISLHHLPSDQGIPNTASYIAGLSGAVICMGDFNLVGEIKAFTDLGLKDSDSTYSNHGIDRIFYSTDKFSCKRLGTIADSMPGISDHQANFALLKTNFE